MNLRFKFIILFALLFSKNVLAQDSSLHTSKFTLSGFVDVYYSNNLNNPASNTQPSFIYNHSYHNHTAVNLALIKANYENDQMRANIGLMTGTYAITNLAAEPSLFQNIYEANVGIKLFKKHNLWFDAGVLTSHIGYESAISKDCWTLTRSISAENSPYYHVGAELTYTTKNEKLAASLLYLNGWQHMQRIPANSSLAGGWQIIYKPTKKISLTSCSFIGNDKPDTAKQMRYFHDFYSTWQVTKKFGLLAGFDIGMEEKAKDTLNEKYNYWYTPVLIARYAFSDKFIMAARIENYTDKNHVIVSHKGAEGSGITGASINTDFYFTQNALLRFEYKIYFNDKKVFENGSQFSNQNKIFSVSLAASF